MTMPEFNEEYEILPHEDVAGVFTRHALSTLLDSQFNDGNEHFTLAVDSATIAIEHFVAFLKTNKIVFARKPSDQLSLLDKKKA